MCFNQQSLLCVYGVHAQACGWSDTHSCCQFHAIHAIALHHRTKTLFCLHTLFQKISSFYFRTAHISSIPHSLCSAVLLKSAWQPQQQRLMLLCSGLSMVTNFKHFQAIVIPFNWMCLTAHFLFCTHYLWSQQPSKMICPIPDLFLIASCSVQSKWWHCTIIIADKPVLLSVLEWNKLDVILLRFCQATLADIDANTCFCSLSRDSSMASRQNTMSEPQEPQDTTPTENNTTNCTNSQTVNNTAPNKQDKAMDQQPVKHTAATSRISTSPPESLDPALDPSSLPPPDPSLDTGNCSAQGDAVQSSTPACLRDGNWFLKLLQAETARMEGWCQQMEQETKDNKLSEEGKWQNSH